MRCRDRLAMASPSPANPGGRCLLPISINTSTSARCIAMSSADPQNAAAISAASLCSLVTSLTQRFFFAGSRAYRAASIALRARRTEGRAAARSSADAADSRLMTRLASPSAIACSRGDCGTNVCGIADLALSCGGQGVLARSARALVLGEPRTRASHLAVDLAHAMLDTGARHGHFERIDSNDAHCTFLDQLASIEEAWMPVGVHRNVEWQHAMKVSAVEHVVTHQARCAENTKAVRNGGFIEAEIASQ